MKLAVRAPATSANLGPGFDCLGLALDLWGAVTVETVRSASGREQGAPRLVRQGIAAAFEGVGKAPAVSVAWDGAIPIPPDPARARPRPPRRPPPRRPPRRQRPPEQRP